MELLSTLLTAYVLLGTMMTVHAFVSCGLPEIRARCVLSNRLAPAYQHAIAACIIALMMGVSWPWVVFGRK